MVSEATIAKDSVQARQNAAEMPSRYTELDSLRGIAALTVVFYHFDRMWSPSQPLAGWRWGLSLLTRPITAGPQAVVLFFVLSGFVLSVPNLRGKRQIYPVYLIRRILRIYFPYLGALALAVLGAAIWHGQHGPNSWAAHTWSEPVSKTLVLQHIFFIGNYDWSQYNTAFWSLAFEMRVSIIFQVIFAIVLRFESASVLICATLLCLTSPFLSRVNQPWAAYISTLPVITTFVVGILLAKHIKQVSSVLRRMTAAGRLAFATVCLLMYLATPHVFRSSQIVFDVQTPLIAFAAAGFVALAIASHRAKNFLNHKSLRFLGRISYSLYLVHATVLFALTIGIRGRLSELEQFPLYLALSLLLATAFCFTVEEPFMRLGRRIGKRSKNGRQPTRTFIEEHTSA